MILIIFPKSCREIVVEFKFYIWSDRISVDVKLCDIMYHLILKNSDNIVKTCGEIVVEFKFYIWSDRISVDVKLRDSILHNFQNFPQHLMYAQRLS